MTNPAASVHGGVCFFYFPLALLRAAGSKIPVETEASIILQGTVSTSVRRNSSAVARIGTP